MTTEELKPVEGQTEEVAKPEATQEPVQTPTYTDDEQLAMASGWMPKDQWKGDPDAWRSAKDFNERGELFERIKQQSRDIQNLKQAMTFLTDQHKRQYIVGYNEAITNLKAKRDAALEDGDLVQAQRLNDKIDDVKDTLKQAKDTPVTSTTTVQPTQEFVTWKGRNSWYMDNKTMTAVADAVGHAFFAENPGTTEMAMLNHVTKEVRKRFPEKFSTGAPPSPDGEGTNRSARGATNPLASIEASMPEEHKAIMRTILKTTPGLTKEQYLKQYGS